MLFFCCLGTKRAQHAYIKNIKKQACICCDSLPNVPVTLPIPYVSPPFSQKLSQSLSRLFVCPPEQNRKKQMTPLSHPFLLISLLMADSSQTLFQLTGNGNKDEGGRCLILLSHLNHFFSNVIMVNFHSFCLCLMCFFLFLFFW